MKKGIILLGLLLILLFGGFYTKRQFYNPKHRFDNMIKDVNVLSDNEKIKDGDLIFQSSLSVQSNAIQLATHSKYSHCGIIYQNGADYYVFEAIQPVTLTPLDKWIARGKDGQYVIKRLRKADSVLNKASILKMKEVGDHFKGKNYDLTFEWSDDKMYCSELIWKIYQRATGIEIGKLQNLQDFDMKDKVVQEIMKVRFGDNIPLDETVISPVAIFESELLLTVQSNE